MSIDNIRFRTEGTLMVLQVLERYDLSYCHCVNDKGTWRDATVHDLLDVANFIAANRGIGTIVWKGGQ